MSRRSERLRSRNGNAAIRGSVVTRRKAELCRKKKALTSAKNQTYDVQVLQTSGGALPCILIETPHKELETEKPLSSTLQSRFKNLKQAPLPSLSWGNSYDVWSKILNKDQKYVHDKSFMEQHPKLQPRMRSILLDWLLEVSEVYTLHRETFYLAQDFFDRFMLTQTAIDQNMLQLIGITVLLIASKVEEIYPPKLQDFAYITDGTCLEEEIKQMELIILKALNWELRPETVISWLKLYIQLASLKDGSNVLMPQFTKNTYIQVTQLLDLCILDIHSLDYQYGILAATAFYHFTSFEVVQCVSEQTVWRFFSSLRCWSSSKGLTWDCIADCVSWMAPFMQTVSKSDTAKELRKMSSEDGYNIQTHVDYLAMLSEAQLRQRESLDRLSPLFVSATLTPPKSAEKPCS